MNLMKPTRICPACQKTIVHSSWKKCKQAIRLGRLCGSCGTKRRRTDKLFFRKCPSCGIRLGYASQSALDYASRQHHVCHSCAMGIINSRPGFKERKNKHLSEIFAGTGNPFYGKTHNPDAIEKMKTSWTIRDTSYLLRPEITSRYGSPGSKNGMYGKSIFEVWTQKYGTEMALQKMASLKQKLSIIFSGENNPMYGKTPPHGSGCGWSGWYKGWFFRSLRELSYVISVLEKDGHTWISAEHGILIRYVDEQGKTRTYRPDFLVDNKLLVEVKPQKLMATARNSIKANAAIEFCKLKGLEYQVTDVEIATNRIIELYKEGAIVFTDKYRKVIDEMIAKYEKPNPLPNRLPLLTAVL